MSAADQVGVKVGVKSDSFSPDRRPKGGIRA